jgi:hypothetical protein
VRNKAFLKKTCIFEKIEMAWMTPEEARARRKEFRPFYRDILDNLMAENLEEIVKFLKDMEKTRIHNSKRRK